MLAGRIHEYIMKHSFERIRLKAVLFDMDGVLFDSMPMHARAWSEAVTRFGLSMTPEEAYEHEGRTGKSTINILTKRFWGRETTDEEVERIYKVKSDLFNSYPEAKRMPGAADLLNQVKRDGFQIVLVTGSGQQSLLNRLNKNFEGIFHKDLMVTSFDVRQGKPSPEPYLMGLRKAGLHPWEAVVVENAPLGVRAGVAANIFTIAVNTGPLPDAKLVSEGANLLFPSMTALAQGWNTLRNALS